MTLPSRRTTLWVAAVFATFVVLLATWAIGMPKSGFPDEPAHTIKAYASAHGDWIGVPIEGASALDRAMRSPADLASASQACFGFQPEVTAACAMPSTDASIVPLDSAASTYPPAYNVVVGTIVRVLGRAHSFRSYRLVSIAIAAALLAFAAWHLARTGRGRPSLLLLQLTPMAVFMLSAVNPTAVEISGCILLWAVLTGWLLGERTPGLRSWLGLSSLAGALVLVRPVTAAWIAVAVGAYLTLERRPSTPGRTRPTTARTVRFVAVASIPVDVAIVASLAWSRYSGIGLSDDRFHLPGGLVDHIRIAFGMIGIRAGQIVGLLGWVDTEIPFPARAAIVAVLVLAATAPFLYGDRRMRIVMGASLAIWVLYPVTYTVLTRSPTNWNGRYDLPLLGVLVLLGSVLLRHRVDERTAGRLLAFVAGAFVVAEVLAFHQALRRYMVGAHGDILLRSPPWHPGVSAWPLIVVNAGAAGVLVALLRRSPSYDSPAFDDPALGG